MGSCSIAQGTQFGALRWPRGVGGVVGGRLKKGWDVCMHIVDSCCCTVELIQHYKAIIFQFEK